MQHAHRITRLSALALSITGALALGQAHATGFQIRENSVQNLGRANAGTAVAQDDASVVSNNPAAMTNIDRTTVQADLTVIDLTADFSGSATSAFGTPVSGGDGGDPGDATAVPALAVVMPLSGAFEGLTVGASIGAPFGLKTEYDADWVGRYNAITSDLKTIDLTLSAALELNEHISIGAGLIYEHAEVTLSNGIDFGTGLAAQGVPGFAPGSADGQVEFTGDNNGVGFILGGQLRVSDRFVVGYSHRSEIDHDLEGEANFTVPANAAAVFGALGIPTYADGPIYAPLTTPSVDTLSAQFDFSDRVRLMADYQRTGWSSLEAVNIYRANGTPIGQEPFDWDDTSMLAVGGEFDLNDAFTLRAGVAADETPTNDEARTPRLPDEDRMLYTIGLGWNVSENLTVDVAYMNIQIDETPIDAVSSSSSRLVGTFDGHADLFGVSARYRF
ncbi:OmpP1/FadL family transporter [Novilysobacter erysipheiresistens]|uniref:Outer membrane protein transport protein n=1 Tax=Novilysobacter erysipheiresistens TaxID=1749332 RepID=A0ABU7Z0F5_9GAMM